MKWSKQILNNLKKDTRYSFNYTGKKITIYSIRQFNQHTNVFDLYIFYNNPKEVYTNINKDSNFICKKLKKELTKSEFKEFEFQLQQYVLETI